MAERLHRRAARRPGGPAAAQVAQSRHRTNTTLKLLRSSDVALSGLARFRVHALLQMASSSATLKLSAELVRLFLAELVQRAAIVAESEGDSIIEVSHIERVLPQLLLDF
eukprot:SM002465S08161  [mRNA]  locus=s2465:449:1135:+ [translate_table: standard]